MKVEKLIKICRMRDPQDIIAVAELSPDYMGFDFCPTRSSYIGEVDESILSGVPIEIRKVGLFMNQHIVDIAAKAGKFRLNSIQIDGELSSAECELISAEGLEIIKCFYISELESFYKIEPYEGVCNRFIFKLSTTLDYSFLDNYRGSTPFMLSMKMDNIEIPLIEHQFFCGFDTANSYELSPARKNINALSELVKKIRDSY